MIFDEPNLTIDVELRNPGQFFACCGLLELAGQLWPGSEGWFASRGSRTLFHVSTRDAPDDPLGEVVRKLCESERLVSLAFDHNAQQQADRKPIVLVPFKLRLDWWLDSYRSGEKSELKVWAGQQTPERNINGLRAAWIEMLRRRPDQASSAGLFSQRWPTTGRFGFDPSASWEALDVGFSPDEQGVPVQTSPATEILAAIGLQRWRPAPAEDRRRWFVYSAWSHPLEMSVAPAAMVGAAAVLATFEFPVTMRNAQYGSFGWAKPLREKR